MSTSHERRKQRKARQREEAGRASRHVVASVGELHVMTGNRAPFTRSEIATAVVDERRRGRVR